MNEQQYAAYVKEQIATRKFTKLIGRTRQRQRRHEWKIRPRGISSEYELEPVEKLRRQRLYGFDPSKYGKFPEGPIHPTIGRLYFGRTITKPKGELPS